MKLPLSQRALWTFLGATLIGPFCGAAFVLLAGLAATAGVPMGRGGASVTAADAARHALETYIWGAFPAALAGATCAAWLSLKGHLPWLVAAVSGAVAATAAAIVTGRMWDITLLSFISAASAVLVWHALTRAGILPRT